jgi:hypothetical protein
MNSLTRYTLAAIAGAYLGTHLGLFIVIVHAYVTAMA